MTKLMKNGKRSKKIKIGMLLTLLAKILYSFDYSWILGTFLSNNEGLK